MKIRTNLIPIVIISLLTLCSCGGTKVLSCPDGEKVVVQKDPEKQYQQTVKKTNTSINGTIDVLNKVNIADLGVDINSEIKELREKLDQFSSRTQDIIKGSYNALQTTPCDKIVRQKHFDLLENVNKESVALETLKAEVQKLNEQGNFGGVDKNQLAMALQKYQSNNVDSLYNN